MDRISRAVFHLAKDAKFRYGPVTSLKCLGAGQSLLVAKAVLRNVAYIARCRSIGDCGGVLVGGLEPSVLLLGGL